MWTLVRTAVASPAALVKVLNWSQFHLGDNIQEAQLLLVMHCISDSQFEYQLPYLLCPLPADEPCRKAAEMMGLCHSCGTTQWSLDPGLTALKK